MKQKQAERIYQMFSGTETVLISLLSTGGAVVLTVWKMSRKFVTLDGCRETRTSCTDIRAQQQLTTTQQTGHLQDGINDLKKTSHIQYKMLRALISHMPNLTADDRERILNAGNGDK